jgi:hypothetical protein
MDEDAFMPLEIEDMLRKSWKEGSSVVMIEINERGENLTLTKFRNSIGVRSSADINPSITVKRGETVSITVVLPKPENISNAIDELKGFFYDVFMNEKSDFTNTEKALMHMTDGARLLETIYRSKKGYGDIVVEGNEVKGNIVYRVSTGADVMPL